MKIGKKLRDFNAEYLIFFVAIALGYYNVVLRPQIYYDDYVNIFSFRLLGNGFNLHSLINSMKITTGGFRPLSYLSFYLNHYLSHGNLKSFIAVNVIIHFFNTIIFYKIALKLTKDRQISFFTALFWAIAPVNLFAVSYLVQRMTSLMAFFGGIAILFYLDWEESKNSKKLFLALFLVALSTLSKESGILFLGFFIVHYYIKNGKKKEINILYIVGILFLIFLYLFSANYFAPEYAKKSWTPIQRFLTETRVLVFYLQNIIFPLEKNIYLFADLKPSANLFTPITTLFSSVFLVFLLVISYLTRKKDKILAICILSFFLFHLLESTFLPLYRVFFHRNYVASFFIILATVNLIFKIKSPLKNILLAVLILNSLWITITHNLKWIYKPYYIEKNYQYYPDNTVSKTKFAMRLEREGKLDEALTLYLDLLKTKDRTWPFIGTVNIFRKKGLNQEAINMANLYPEKDPELLRIMALSYLNLNNFEKAEEYFKKSLNLSFSPANLLSFISILYENGLYDKVVFEVEKNSQEFEKFYTDNNKVMNSIYNAKIIFTRILLTSIECRLRTNIGNIEKDIKLLKKYGIYNKNIKNYINALVEIKNKNYEKALKFLNLINVNLSPNEFLFLFLKKTVFTLCIYDKTGQEKKFKDLIEKFSKNTIIYNSLWRGLDKCY